MSELGTDGTENSGSVFGGGGRIYRDSRPTDEQPKDPDVPPWADQPEPIKEPTPIRRPSVVKTVQPPEPEPVKEPRNWREPVSTVFEVIGMIGLSVTGFLIALWVGVLIASICMIVLGVTISREPVNSSGPTLLRRPPGAPTE